MRNRNSSFEDIVKSVNSSVKSNSISEKYADFLNQCKDLNISSYSLNTIIHYAHKNKKDKTPNVDLDKSMFISDSETKQVQEEEKEIVIKEVVKEKWNGNMCFLTVLVTYVIWFFGSDFARSFNNNSKDDTVFELKQKLEQRDVEIDTLRSSIEQQEIVINNQGENYAALTTQYDNLIETVSWKTDSITNLNMALADMEEDLSMKNKEIKQLEDRIESIGNYYPIIIDRIEIGNSDYDGNIQTDYGNTIYNPLAELKKRQKLTKKK